MEGSKLTLVPTVEAGLMVRGLFPAASFFLCLPFSFFFIPSPPSLPPSHSSPSIIKAPGARMCWQPQGSAAQPSLRRQRRARQGGSSSSRV